MRTQTFDFLSSICFETISFALIGYAFISPSIFDPTTHFFTVTILAVSAIVIFNLLEFYGTRFFLGGSMLVSLLFLISWFDNSSILSFSRNTTWFFLLASSVYGGYFLIHRRIFQRSRFGPLLIWIIVFLIIYEVAALLNFYVFSLHLPEEPVFTLNDFRATYRAGSTTGFSIGLGYILANLIIPFIEDYSFLKKYLKD